MSAAPPTDRRARRREQTRSQLTEAATDLISEKGVDNLRIAELTAAADVALGSFYNHFESKEQLVETIVSDSLETLAAAVAVFEPGQDPAALVAAAIRRFVRIGFDDPAFAQLLVRLNHADALFATAVMPHAREALAHGIAERRLHAADAEVALTAIVAASLGMLRAIVAGRHADGAEVAFAEHVLCSLGVPPAEARQISAGASA